MASIQSDTSGSQVRQFGLYRSIDSRTEEFLRLSRKRQMRQGCACAAISTAITVTIIIGILLVFEFKIPIDTENKSVKKCNSFFNDTAEAMSLKKPNTNIDKATLKILPTLIKALNKSKIIESTTENTSNNPIQEKRHTTEFALKKNLFSNRNSWFRYPTSRVYTVEYKTSPVVYFKTPKNDYYTKIRKIRDYQRIINYVDKMISERVPFGATQPMRTIEDYSVDDHTQGKITTLAQKTFRSPVDSDESSEASILKVLGTTANTRKNEDKHKCKCPDKIAQIMNNLLSNIKLLVPHFSTTESVLKKLPCDKIHKLRVIDKNHYSSSRDSNDLQVTEISKELLKQGTSLRPYIKLKSNTKKSETDWQSSFREEKNLNTIFGLLQQRFVGQKTYLFKSDIKNIITTPPMVIEKTEINEVKSTTPKEKFVKYDPLHLISTAPDYEEVKNNPDGMLSEKVLTTSNLGKHYAKYAPLYFIANKLDGEDNSKNDDENMSLKKNLSNSAARVHPVKNNSLHLDATTKYYRQGNRENEKRISEKEDDQSESVSFSATTNTAEKYLNLDVHSLELLKKKRISTSVNNDKTIIKPYPNNYINVSLSDSKDSLSTKPNMKWYLSKENSEYNNIFYPIVTTHFLYHRHNGTSKFSMNSESITTTEDTSLSLINNVSTTTTHIDIENKHTSPSMETFNVTTNCSKTRNDETDMLDFDQKDKEDIGFHLEELNLDEDLEKVIDEDNYQENYIKDDYSSTIDNKLDVPTEKNLAPIAADKEKEDTSSVLNIKPRSYLEIQGDYLQQGEDDEIFIKRLFDYLH